ERLSDGRLDGRVRRRQRRPKIAEIDSLLHAGLALNGNPNCRRLNVERYARHDDRQRWRVEGHWSLRPSRPQNVGHVETGQQHHRTKYQEWCRDWATGDVPWPRGGSPSGARGFLREKSHGRLLRANRADYATSRRANGAAGIYHSLRIGWRARRRFATDGPHCCVEASDDP